MKGNFLHILLLVLVLNSGNLFAQTGKEFWFVAPDITSGHSNEDGNQRFLWVSAMSLGTQVTVSQPANPGFTPITFTLAANQTQMFDLSTDSFELSPGATGNWGYKTQGPGHYTIENTPPDAINNFGILIESEELITAYYEVRSYFNPELWALKGENALGRDFWIPMQNRWQNGNFGGSWNYNPTPYNEAHIVASEDNTVVTINNTAAAVGHAAGSTFSITLNKGQTYNLRAAGYTGIEHLSGTHITSTKPIAVTISDDSVQKTNPTTCYDINGDQLVPTDYIGTEYIVMKGRIASGERVFVTATIDSTNIFVGTSTTPLTTIDAGETYGIPLTVPNTFIRTSENAYLYHMGGFGCEMGGALLPSIHCTGSIEVYFSRANSQPFFINLMVPASAEGDFWIEYTDSTGTLQNINLPTTLFEYVSGTGDTINKGLPDEKVIPRWMALKANINNTNYFNFIPENTVIKVYNTNKPFHLGIYNGGTSTGCNYGYFSDFGQLDATAEISLNDGSYIKACSGDSVQLIATGGTSYNWIRTVNDTTQEQVGYISDNTIPNPIVMPPEGTHKYTATIIGGIPGLCPVDTFIDLIVNIASYLDASFSVVNPIVCAPDSIKLINKSVNVDKEYYWDFGDGQTATFPGGGDTIIYHYYENKTTDSAVYTINLRVQNQKDCFKSAERTVMIYPEIQADFNFSPFFSPTLSAGCNPHEVTFENTSSGNLDTYAWDFGDIYTSIDSLPPPHTYTNFGESDSFYTVSLIATSPYYCTDTVKKEVQVYPYLEADFTINKNNICAPDTIMITNNSEGGISSTIWTWGVGSYLTPISPLTDKNIYLVVENTGLTKVTDTITLTIENYQGCSEVIRRVVTIYPEITSEFTADITEGCAPFTTQFTDASNAVAVNADNYNWDFGDGGSSSLQSPNHLYINNTANSITRQVILTTTSDDNCVAYDTINIKVKPFVKAGFTIDNADSCADFNVKISNESIGDKEFYSWTYGDGATSADDNDIHYHLYENNTATTQTYDLKLITYSSEGCADSMTRQISAYPKIDTWLSDTLRADCHPLTINFISTRNTASAISSFIWDFGDGSSYNYEDTTHVFKNFTNKDTTYIVVRTATTPEGCVDIDTARITVFAYLNANFTVDVASGCHPLPVNHIFAGAGDTTGGITWKFGNLGTKTEINPSYTYPNNNDDPINIKYTTTLLVENGQGCQDSVSKIITVFPKPKVDFDTVPLPNHCQPVTYTFQNKSNNVAATYYWDFGDGALQSVNAINKSTDIGHKYTNLTAIDKIRDVNLIGISSQFCRDTIEKQIHISPYIEAEFTIKDSAAACSPHGVNFIASPKGNYAYGDWFFGYGNNTYNYTNLNIYHTFPPNKDYNNPNGAIYPVFTVAYNKDGCPDTSNTEYITIYPEVKANFMLDKYDGCHSEFTPVFSNTSSTNSNYFLWDLDYKNLTSSLKTPAGYNFTNISHTKDTTYTIKLQVWSEYYCTDDTAIDITVHYKPNVMININDPLSTGEPLICSPYTPVFVNNSLGSDPIEFTWNFGDGSANKKFTDWTAPVHNYVNLSSLPVSYNIKVDAVTSHNCASSGNISINVNPEVEANFSSDTAGCNRYRIQLFSTDTKNGNFFSWQFGDGESSTQPNPIHEFQNYTNTDQRFDITLTSKSLYDCIDDTTKQITVYPQPQADFSVSPTRTQYPDTTFNFINNANTGNWLYQWKFEKDLAFDTLSDENFYHSYPSWTGGTYNITFVVLNPNHPECIDTATHTVFVDAPYPEIRVYADTNQGCQPVTITFTDSSKYTYPNKNVWDYDDGTIDIGKIKRKHEFYQDGLYRVSLEVTGPGGTALSFIPISTHPLPEPNSSINPKIVYMPNAVISCANLTPGGTEHNYLWDFGDGNFSTEFQPTHVYEEERDGGFQVKLIATTKYNCVDSVSDSAAMKIRVLGMGIINFPNAFTPSGDGINDLFKPCCEPSERDSTLTGEIAVYAQCDCSLIKEYTFEIYNRWGEKVYFSDNNDINSDRPLAWNGYIYRNGTEPTDEKGAQQVYVYRLKGKWANGVPFDKAGSFLLIR